MKTFLTDDFLLRSDVARELYHTYARPLPIYDYHSHLPPEQIAENHRFADLTEAWLAGDHYKWRAMRWNGVPERFITGDATPWEKFLAWARTVPKTLRNPLYHWTHLELQYYFGIDDLLDETTAESIWNRANKQLAETPVHALLTKSRVAVVCTTDDPADNLAAHQSIAPAGTLMTRVYPTFRLDNALLIDQPAAFNAWVDKLETASGISCDTGRGFLDALAQRHEYFHQNGGRLSDHGLAFCPPVNYRMDINDARHVFEVVRAGKPIGPIEVAQFQGFLMVYFGFMDANNGWTKQLHLGPLRSVSTRGLQTIGPNTGFDSIGDTAQADALARYLDRLDRGGKLPKTVLYNVNPADNYVLATMAGNFQDGSVPGKIQFGSAWWFLDQKDGMEGQLNALSNVGLLSRFVGMLTDSRSFLSFPRHDYFRRVLCNLLGGDVENGELPRDLPLLGALVADVCYHNAHAYFGLDVPAVSR